MKRVNRFALVGLFLGLSVGCDQATKHIATNALQSSAGYSYLGDTFRLQYAENRGAFLSLGANLPGNARFWVLTVSVGLLLAGILVFTLLNKKLDAQQISGYAFIVGGGLSNWVDRALKDGAVVDFMNMGIGPVRTGVFNVADLAIIVGIGLLLLASWRKERRRPPGPADPAQV
jgi:signal peptidase II